MKVALKPVVVTQRWPHKLYQIERTSIQEERLLRLGEPDTMEENVIPEMVVEPQESRLEVQRSEMPEPTMMRDKWRSVIQSAMELQITLKAMGSAIQRSGRTLKRNCGRTEFELTMTAYKKVGWIDQETEMSVA